MNCKSNNIQTADVTLFFVVLLFYSKPSAIHSFFYMKWTVFMSPSSTIQTMNLSSLLCNSSPNIQHMSEVSYGVISKFFGSRLCFLFFVGDVLEPLSIFPFSLSSLTSFRFWLLFINSQDVWQPLFLCWYLCCTVKYYTEFL